MNKDLELSKEKLEKIKKDHFEREYEEKEVSEAEVKGLALNLVELEEMHYKLVEKHTEFEELLNDAQARIDKLAIDEEDLNG